MASVYSLVLVGFAQEESATFESFFRLAARRPPAYRVQDEVIDAQLLLVNADNAQAMHLVRFADLPGKVLLVGHHDAGSGWPLERKPVKLVSVLSALDRLVGVRRPVAAAPARAPLSATAPARPAVHAMASDRGFAATEPFTSGHLPLPRASAPAPVAVPPDSDFPPTRPMVRERVAPVAAMPGPAATPTPRAPAPQARPGVLGLTDFGGLDEQANPRTPDSQAPASRAPRSTNAEVQRASAPAVPRADMLLVAESLVEGRILHKRFKRYGLTIDWSREATQAQAMLKVNAYRLVAIDRLGGHPDAYDVCRSAKQRKLPNGQSPVVIMFAPNAGSMDRLKAGLAGSDAYLSRSVAEADFYKLLAQHRLVSLDGFEKTNMGY